MDLHCPTCHKELDMHAAIPDGTPVRPPLPGDFCICAYCNSVLTIREDGLRLATTADVETMGNEAMKRKLLHLISLKRRPH